MPQMANRVQETTTTGGTGTITLGGAVTGYLTFASSFTTSSVLFYTIDNGVGEWEIGIGTLVTTGTLSRNTVIASSNGGALVNFGSGTKRVFCSAPTRSLVPDQDSKSGYVLTTDGTDPAWTQTLNSITIGNTTPAAGAFTTLSASSTVSGTGFSTYLASPPAIGGTAPAAGSFTNLSYTGTLTGGTGVIAIGTNQIYKDASGNVGIGTNTPGYRLQVNGSISSTSQTPEVCTNPGIQFRWNASEHIAQYKKRGTTHGYFWRASDNGLDATNTLTLAQFYDDRILLHANDYERLRVDSTKVLFRQLNSSSNISVSFDTTAQNALTLASTGVLTVSGNTATPAGGSTSARLIFGTTAGFGIYYGSGAPTVSAAQGSIYLRSDGSSASTRLYVNTNGSTTWTNVTTAN